MDDRPTLLDVHALGKSVPGPRRLFRNLDLQVGAGELVAIIGESGVGKSTLLNILAGLDDADEGTVAIGGTVLGPRDVTFRPLATWRSTATGAVYPVSQELSIRVNGRVTRWRLTPMFAAQELDARRGGLPVYWEGAVSTRGGRGYLELTGYDRALRM